MPCRPHGHAWRHGALIGAVLYVVFLAADPFEHHDLACHVRAPLHCMACASSPLSSVPQTSAVFDTWHLADAGSAVALLTLGDSAMLPVRSTGRSPPPLA